MPIKHDPGCNVADRLLLAYRSAITDYNKAVPELERDREIIPRREYDQRRRAIELASRKFESSSRSLDRHIIEQG